MQTELKGLNADLLSNLMCSYGIKNIIGDDSCWWEKSNNYGVFSFFSSLSPSELVQKIHTRLNDIQVELNNNMHSIKKYTRTKTNLFIPQEKIGKKCALTTIKAIFERCPTTEYIYKSLYIYPFINEDCKLSPIGFAEENQRNDYKFGLKAANFANTLQCNRVIQGLMWEGINNYIDVHEIDTENDMKNHVGQFFIRDIFSKRKNENVSLRLNIPIFSKNNLTICNYKYKKLMAGGKYAYWSQILE